MSGPTPKTRTEVREAYDGDVYEPSRYPRRHDPSVVERLASLQRSVPESSRNPFVGSNGRPHDPFGALAEEEAHRHRRARLSGGFWVAPLQGAQFAGSPQADTQTDPGDAGGDSGASGDAGGTT